MEEAQSVSSRRGLLGRGLLVAAGVIGLGGAVSARVRHAARAVKPSRTELKLYGRNSIYTPRIAGRGSCPGRAIATPRTGSCSTARTGRSVGHFSAAHMSLDSPFAAASSLEIHTFDLTEGRFTVSARRSGERTATSSCSAGPGATRAHRELPRPPVATGARRQRNGRVSSDTRGNGGGPWPLTRF